MLTWKGDLIESVPTIEDHTTSTVDTGARRRWPVLPISALHGVVGDLVRAIEPHSESDPAAILIQGLVALGNLLGPVPHCTVEATRHSLNLYGVLVGETSKGRKGTSWGHIQQVCSRVDDTWAKERITKGLSSSEGLISEVQDGAQFDRRLLIVQSEFASVLKIMTREGNTLSATLRDAWDSGDLRTLTKNNPLRATGAHISTIAHITLPELLRYLSDTEAHNGFANRMLWCCVQRSKCLPEGGRVPVEEVDSLRIDLSETVQWLNRQGEMELRRDDAARDLWASVYPKLSTGLPGLLGAATSRSEAQVLRLSALYATLDRSTVIRPDHLKAALAVWDYCNSSARFIFGDAVGDPVADRIREALLNAGTEGLTRTEISDLFKRNIFANRITQALNTLASLDMAECRQQHTEGRSIELWVTK